MLVTVKGTYADGVVRLDEPGPAASAEVLVTFLDVAPVAGSLAAAVRPPVGSPNERMAQLLASWEQARHLLAGMKGRSLSDEVLAERYEDE